MFCLEKVNDLISAIKFVFSDKLKKINIWMTLVVLLLLMTLNLYRSVYMAENRILYLESKIQDQKEYTEGAVIDLAKSDIALMEEIARVERNFIDFEARQGTENEHLWRGLDILNKKLKKSP